MARAASEERFIFEEITAALRRHGLDYDSPLRQVLNLGARVAGTHEFSVLALDDRGNSIPLDHRLEELKTDPRYAELFPNPPRVPRDDMSKLKANFDRIARGDVIAE